MCLLSKVGTIIPHTLIPRALLLGAMIVQEKLGYDWSYVRKIRTKIQRFSDLFFRTFGLYPHRKFGDIMGVSSENPKKKIRKSLYFRPDFPYIGPVIPPFLLDNPGTQKNAGGIKVCGMIVPTFIEYKAALGLRQNPSSLYY